MSIFDEREKAFESQYSRDQELEFKILVRRDKLFGLWAAKVAGLSDESAHTFALSVIDQEVSKHSVVHKVGQDLIAMGHQISEKDLNAKLVELHELAREQVYKETA